MGTGATLQLEREAKPWSEKENERVADAQVPKSLIFPITSHLATSYHVYQHGIADFSDIWCGFLVILDHMGDA